MKLCSVFLLIALTGCCGRSYDKQLLDAVRHNDIDSVKRLIHAGASVNAHESTGKTALMDSADLGHLDILQLLISVGADPNATDHHGTTALLWACLSGQASACEALVMSGADIEKKDNIGLTPLFAAAYKGHADIVQILLRKGASIDTHRLKGRTPLRAATGCAVAWMRVSDDCNGLSTRFYHTVKVLLDNGADFRSPDEQGISALAVAEESGIQELIRLFYEAIQREAEGRESAG